MGEIFLKHEGGRVLLDFPAKNEVLWDTCSEGRAEMALLQWEEASALLGPRAFANWAGYGGAASLHGDANFLFKGNNLRVLHAIAPVFEGSIQLIYIDPPYNTGNTFVYKDKMSRALWLLFMKNRLEIARPFLREQGVIVVQCDENEQAYLKVLMDELFGEACFIGMVTVLTNPGGRDYRSLARTHEYLLFYGKSASAKLNPLPREKPFPFNDALGGFELRSLRNGNIRFHIGNRPNLCYPFYVDASNPDAMGLCPVFLEPAPGRIEIFPKISQGVQTVWRWGRQKSSQNLTSHLAARPSGESFLIFEKYRKDTRLPRTVWGEADFQAEEQPGALPGLATVWDEKNFQTSKGTKQLKEMFGTAVFDYPKPEALIRRIITLASSPGDRVMDFFLGSGTTASAAHKEGRTWLGIEQMDYFHTVTVPRLNRVIQEQGGAFMAAELSPGEEPLCPLSKTFYSLRPQ